MLSGIKIVSILILCFGSLIIVTNAKSIDVEKNVKNKKSDKEPFTLDEVIASEYTGDPFNGTWLSDSEFYYNDDDRIVIFDVGTLKTKLFVEFDDVVKNLRGNYKMTISPDRNYILIRNDTRGVYRHSTLSSFSIYNVNDKSMKSVQDDKPISLAQWTPSNNAIVYVMDNDIYYYEVKYDKHRRLTDTGEYENIYNGISDWVYDTEEVFSSDKALWISPNGEHLAFATFNDSEVHEMVISKYGNPENPENQYPKEVKFRYPKSGTPNPRVTLNLIDLSDHGSTATPLHVPVDVVGTEPILFAVTWFDNKTVVATWTNRVQNKSQIISYTIDGQYHYLIEQSESRGWLLNTGVSPLYYNNNVLLLKSQDTANKSLGSFSHLTRYRLLNDVLSDEVDLSPGRTWVTSILGVSDLKRAIYFIASPANEPAQRHLYEVSLVDPENAIPEPTCVSCDVVSPEGNKCKYVGSVKFSKDFSHYVLTCSGPDAPFTSIYDYKHSVIYSWTNNDELRKKLEKRRLPKIENLIIDSNGYDVRVRLYLPDDLDETKKYPLLLNVYGGPDSQRIYDNFAVGLESYMTTNRRVAYVHIDGRGSSSKGTAIMYEVYRNLGDAEIADQIHVVSKLAKMYKWIDRNRIGCWGWSYGGYSTAMILSNDIDQVFKCGISVAPVVNWIFYDSIYTERYMGLPSKNDNLEKYQSSSVLSRANNFKNKQFMLVHGTGDDNVHFQQSMMLSRVLAENDVMYEQFVYPDEAHGLDHVTTHLYHTMDRFWANCFGYKVENNTVTSVVSKDEVC